MIPVPAQVSRGDEVSGSPAMVGSPAQEEAVGEEQPVLGMWPPLDERRVYLSDAAR